MQVVWIARHRHIGDAFFDADAAQFLREQLQASRGELVRSYVLSTIAGTTFATCMHQSRSTHEVLRRSPCGHISWIISSHGFRSVVHAGRWK